MRETHALKNRYRNVWCEYAADGHRAVVAAPEFVTVARPGWRPSIHMPRWASRITLEITGIRAEKLQDISAEDAMAEGAKESPQPYATMYSFAEVMRTRYREGFANLWESIYGPGSWDANPWVWVIGFRRVEA